jgi:hypothetical protein
MAKFTRHHYEAIAETLRENVFSDKAFTFDTESRLFIELCAMFEEDNRNFDEQRFYAACFPQHMKNN